MTTESWARLSSDAFNLALFSYIAAMVASFAYLAFRKERLHTVATTIGVIGLVANGVSIVTRGIAAGPHAVGQHVRVLHADDVPHGPGVPVDHRGAREGADRGRVRLRDGRPHDGDGGVVLLRGADGADAGAQLVLAADPRDVDDRRVVAARDRVPAHDRLPDQARGERRALGRLRSQAPPPIMGGAIDTSDPSAPPGLRGGRRRAGRQRRPRAGSRSRRRPRWTRSRTSSSGSGSPCGRSA